MPCHSGASQIPFNITVTVCVPRTKTEWPRWPMRALLAALRSLPIGGTRAPMDAALEDQDRSAGGSMSTGGQLSAVRIKSYRKNWHEVMIEIIISRGARPVKAAGPRLNR